MGDPVEIEKLCLGPLFPGQLAANNQDFLKVSLLDLLQVTVRFPDCFGGLVEL